MFGKAIQKPRLHIDDFIRFSRAIHIRGWCELNQPRAQFGISGTKFSIVASDIRPSRRGDVAEAHGKGAENWGFEAIAIFANDEEARLAATAPLTFSSSLGSCEFHPQNYGNGYGGEPLGLEARFFDAIRSHPKPRVLELGSRARSGISRRGQFGNADYFGVDILPGENVDAVADAHALSQHDFGKFDFVFSVSVFEHLLMPWKVAVELSRVMNDGGLVFLQTHQAWPEHDAPWDYWRFSTNAWHAIFNKYTGFEIVGASYREPCYYVSAFETGNPITNLGRQKGFYAVQCLARKTGEAMLDWDLAPSDLLNDGGYPV
jgi:hypothetical protein